MMRRQWTGSPAGEMLAILQRRGQATVKDLERALGVTATAVRQQLAVLLAEGCIDQRAENIGRGRPKHVYSLTAKGRERFPHHGDDFTSSLLREILLAEGASKVQELLERLSRRMAEGYARRIAGRTPFERLSALAGLLNTEGVLAEVRREAGSVELLEYTCPYYELAREHRAICAMEQQMISEVIGRPVKLMACSLDGHHGCRFRIGAEA